MIVGVRWKGEAAGGRTGGARASSGGADKRHLGEAIATLLLGLYRDDGGLEETASR